MTRHIPICAGAFCAPCYSPVVGNKPKDPAKHQKWLAQRQAMRDGEKKSPGPAGGEKNLSESFDERRKEAGIDKLTAIENLRLKYVSLLHEIGGEKFSQIDRILGLDPGMSQRWAEKHPTEYTAWTKEHIDKSLTKYYKHRISVLATIIDGGLSSIRMWKEIQADPTADFNKRAKAAGELKDWYALLMKAQQQGKIKQMIPAELQEAHEEAIELEKRLVTMLDENVKEPEEPN